MTKKLVRFMFLCAGVCGMLGCQTGSRDAWKPDVSAARLEQATMLGDFSKLVLHQHRFFKFQSTVLLEYRDYKMAMLLVGEVDREAQCVKLAAVSPTGLKIFEVYTVAGKIEKKEYAAGVPTFIQSQMSRMIARDMSNIFLTALDGWRELIRREDKLIAKGVGSDGKACDFYLGGHPLLLYYTASSAGWWGTRWHITYDYDTMNKTTHSQAITYRNCTSNYSMKFTNLRIYDGR